MKFVIEHLEPELFGWCLIEYEHISQIAGKENLIFANIKNKKDAQKLKRLGKVFGRKIAELGGELRFNENRICILSQYSKKALTAKDRDKFKYFVFGGILGDNPARKRTNSIISSLKNKKIKYETRNLGKRQMPTDAAVYAAKKILNGAKFHNMKFCDNVEIEINKNESVALPFRYIIDGNKLVISEKLVGHLRKRKGF